MTALHHACQQLFHCAGKREAHAAARGGPGWEARASLPCEALMLHFTILSRGGYGTRHVVRSSLVMHYEYTHATTVALTVLLIYRGMGLTSALLLR